MMDQIGTDPALLTSIRFQDRILRRKFMTALAMGNLLPSMSPHPLLINFTRNRFEMIRIHARAIPAQMIDLGSFRQISLVKQVSQNMRADISPLVADIAVSEF